jgi:hypothetical protein
MFDGSNRKYSSRPIDTYPVHRPEVTWEHTTGPRKYVPPVGCGEALLTHFRLTAFEFETGFELSIKFPVGKHVSRPEKTSRSKVNNGPH